MTYVAILLLMLVAFTVVGWPLVGSSRGARRESSEGSPGENLVSQRDAAYGAIKELDFEYELGNLSESDYQGLRERYRNEAAAALRKLDATASGPAASTEVASPESPRAGLACPSCGKPTAFGDRYCWNCGEQRVHRCPQCALPVLTGDRFCASCGAPQETEA